MRIIIGSLVSVLLILAIITLGQTGQLLAGLAMLLIGVLATLPEHKVETEWWWW